MKEYIYNRKGVIDYAKEWALKRNPKYFNFDNFGGDCTNFASQCLFAGSGVMNYEPVFGWYYIDANNKSPSWTGVEFLYNFLISNKGPGPFGEESDFENAQPGDVIQLSYEGETFTHSMIVTGIRPRRRGDSRLLISAHSYDARNRPLSTYDYEKARVIHILGVGEPEE